MVKKKIKIKRIRTKIKTLKTKRINVYFLEKERKELGESSHRRQITHHLPKHVASRGRGKGNTSNNIKEDII
jgi:hypothetical protein